MSIWILVLVLGAFLGPLIAVGTVSLAGYRLRRRGRRNPLSRRLLRSPGQSLLGQIDDLRWDIAVYFGLAMLPAPFLLAMYFYEWARLGQQPHLVYGTFLGLLFLIGQGWLSLKFWRNFAAVRPLRLGYEAELAAGQELNDLGTLGYRVFHDLPVEDQEFNVDHVLVGPGGVFAVETKGRSKPKAGDADQDEWEVRYDGEVLDFPGWRERKALIQAKAIAKWVQEWVSGAVGERVNVQPVLVLPGWYVKRTSGGGIPVISGRQIKSYFGSLRRESQMTDKMIERIAFQLDQRCRDVEPRAYAKPKKDR